MSGGRFQYQDIRTKEEIFGYRNEWSNVFEDLEISELVWDVFNLIHNFDWYISCDTCEETYLKKKEEFKNKWLRQDEKSRCKRMIDKTIETARSELYKTYGVETKYDRDNTNESG